MPAWIPKIRTLEDDIASELARLEALKLMRDVPIWSPPIEETAEPMAPVMPAPETWRPAPQTFDFAPTEPPRNIFAPPPTAVQTPTPITPPTPPAVLPKPKKQVAITKQEAVAPMPSPFKIEESLPLWAKTMAFIGKPFELIQRYLFDPALSVIHTPFAEKIMPPDVLKLAKEQGVASYLPGGVRYNAYEKLQYPGKWAVEMLPWLLVPPIGTVGLAGVGGRGVAGALSKAGVVGQFAGRVLEYSPAGLVEKGTGKIISAVTGKAIKAVRTPAPEENPLITKVIGIIKSAQAKSPEQKLLTKELRARQIQNAMPELQEGTGEKALHNFMKALQGEGEKVEWAGIRKLLSQSEIDSLSNMISKSEKVVGFDKIPAVKGWRKILDGGELPYDSELEQLEKVFGSDLVGALLEKRPENIVNRVSDVANASRAVLASVDLSGLLRQGFILATRHPIEALKTVKPMLKAFLSDANAGVVDDLIKARPHTQMLVDNGMYLAPLPARYGTTALSKLEESFMSKWIEGVPVIGSLVKASNRSYSTVLNDLRSRMGEATLSMWEKAGVKTTELDMRELGKLINSASGRGTLPQFLVGASPLMNATLFSPRLFISRLQFPAKMFSPSKLVRREAARTLVQFLGVGTSIVGMAKLAGAGTELDPRSADFGKLRIGNTRLDIWTGYSQWSRFVAQLVTAQRKTQSGYLTEQNRLEVVDRFMTSKFSPAMGLLNDILRGETYMGEEVNLDTPNIKRQVFTRIMPLFIQDMIDAVEQEGLIGGVIASPGLLGVGVVTYMSPAQKLRDKLAQEKYGMNWEQVGASPQLGRATQMDLERSSPELLAEIQKEREDYDKTISGKADINNIYRNQTETIEKEFKGNVSIATQEYRDTKDGYAFKEKLIKLADNRRSQYDILNKNPQFKDIVARYDELPSAADLKKMSPQDWARKEYMRMIYSDDMYDQYGNYRFDAVEDMRQLFIQTYGQSMLDYVETYQNTKDSDMPAEYRLFKEAQKILRPYWQIADKVEQMFGKTFAESTRGQAIISKQRKALRLSNPKVAQAYEMFYKQS